MSTMQFAIEPSLQKRQKAGALILPYWSGEKGPVDASDSGKKFPSTDAPIKAKDFNAKEGEVIFLYAKGEKEPRLVLLGLGDQKKITVEKLRRAYSSLAKALRVKKIDSVNVLAPQKLSVTDEDVARGIVEGLLLTNYVFEKLKSHSKDKAAVLLKKVTIIGFTKKNLTHIKKLISIAEGVYLTRDLVNGNADDVTPEHLAQLAKKMEKSLKNVKTTVFGKKRIEKEKMGLLLAVNRGSHMDPAFIIVEYKGNPKSKDKTVLVGKGITYDTGGLNLKPTGSMEDMKCDMAGSATVFGALHAVATLGLKTNLTIVVPSTENPIDTLSYKPGDVYTSYAGKTVEIGNTDAEGRLVLADALAYTVDKLKPTRVIDFATLTGAMVIALGEEVTGVMSNNDVLADSLLRAGNTTFERLCRMPIYEEYEDQLKSDVADMKNTGGRAAGSITAALFLKKFVNETPWAHLDIAGTAYLSKARRYHPKNATGIGVRLIVELLENEL